MSSEAAPRRGWYYGWNIVAVCILAQLAGNGLPVNAFSLFLKPWSEDLNTPISTLQLALAVMGVASALSSPFFGALADKRPARWLFGIGLVGVVLFYVGLSFVNATWQLIALYGLLLPAAIGVSSALTANSVVSRWFVRRLGLALGLSAFGIGLAGVILPPIVAALLPEIGWRAIWRVGGLLIAIVVTPIVFFVVRERPTEREGLHYVAGAAAAHGGHGHAHGADGSLRWKDIFARRNFWLLLAVYLPILAIYGGGAQNLAPIAIDHGLSQQAAGAMISVLSMAHVVATLALGLLSDRFGNRIPFVGLALLVAAGGAILAFGHGLAAVAIGAALIGAGGGLFTLLAAALAVEFGASGFGRAFGTAMSFLPVTALAPFAIAKSQETTGSYAPALAGLAVVAVIGGLLCLLLRERRHGHATPDEKAAAVDEAVPPPIAP